MNRNAPDEEPELGPAPRGWGRDALSSYLDLLRRNQLASYQQLSGSYARLRDLDGLYLKVAKNLDNIEQTAPALFFYRAHAAFRAVIGLVLAGQVVETYAMLRNCLEQALYAYFIYKDPKRWDVWQGRHDSREALKKVKQLFRISDMLSALQADHPRDGSVTADLYEHTINLGAHPNAFGLFQGVDVSEDSEATTIVTQYLHPSTPAHKAALLETARAGVAVLGIFAHIFEPRSTLLGIWNDLAPLKTGL